MKSGEMDPCHLQSSIQKVKRGSLGSTRTLWKLPLLDCCLDYFDGSHELMGGALLNTSWICTHCWIFVIHITVSAYNHKCIPNSVSLKEVLSIRFAVQ